MTTKTGKKPTKSPKKAKTLKLPKSPKVKKPARDNARVLANLTEKKFNSDQIRILRSLNSSKKAITRLELLALVGINGKYSQSWLNSLKDLETKKLISIRIAEEGSKSKGFTHQITSNGKSALEKLEKLAKDLPKAKAS